MKTSLKYFGLAVGP